EEAWLSRYGDAAKSVHLEIFPEVPASWRDDKLADKWRNIRTVRRVVTGALEIERAQKRIGSSLEARPVAAVSNGERYGAVVDCDLAEVCITSAATLVQDEGPSGASRLPDVTGVAVVPNLAEGKKCARSWKILTTIGADPEYPDVSPRDAKALRGWEAARRAAGSILISRSYFTGPLKRFGLTVSAIVCALDQAAKIYLLFVFDLAANGPVRLGPFIDIVLARNTGISYGLFQTQGALGQWILLGFKTVA